MGRTYEAKCLDCGNVCKIDEGGGFFFDLLNCDMCGRTSGISTSPDGNEALWLLRTGGDHRAYKSAIEKVAGKCECGGHFKFDAPARCPNCKSTNLVDTGKDEVMYD